MSYLEGMFEADLFDEFRGMGDLPSDAQPIAQIESYRSRFPRLTSLPALRSAGLTHFSTAPSGTSQSFRFYDATGAMRSYQLLPLPQSELPSGPVDPVKDTVYTSNVPAPLPGDGLLPTATDSPSGRGPTGAERWLPWALLGGAVVLGGGMVWMASRRPRRVAANRKRRSRRSR